MPTLIDIFRDRFGVQFKEQEPLAKHLNIRIGGPVPYFVEARSVQDVTDAVQIAAQAALPYFILGGGSNTLVADEGWNGLVIKIALRAMRIEGELAIAEAGVISAALARATADKGLRGFEWAISLPGTIGGAVRGNAGCFGGEIKDNLLSAKLLRAGRVVEVPASELHFAYRHSALKDKEHEHDVVLEATFKLTPGDRAEAMAALEKNLAGRKASQPLGSSSAGCMFKNYEIKAESEKLRVEQLAPLPEGMAKLNRIGAGWIIDQLDLKGTQVGDAQVSPQHGNFLLNKGHATAKDIATLISLIKTKVRDQAGIQLEEEVRFLGF